MVEVWKRDIMCLSVSVDPTRLNIVACLGNNSLKSEDYFKLLALQSLRRHGPQRRGLVYPEQIKNSASKRSIRRFVITEKAPTRAFSWLKVATTAFTFKTLC